METKYKATEANKSYAKQIVSLTSDNLILHHIFLNIINCVKVNVQYDYVNGH